MYTPGTIANLQTDRIPTKINKNGAVAKVRILVDNIRNLKILRVISHEILFSLLILCWCYFSYLKMYPDKFFNV